MVLSWRSGATLVIRECYKDLYDIVSSAGKVEIEANYLRATRTRFFVRVACRLDNGRSTRSRDPSKRPA